MRHSFSAACLALPLVLLGSATVVGQQAATDANRYDTSASDYLALIPPGTVVGTTAPANWTHLILKSLPRTAAGDVNRVPRMNLSIASLFSTSMVAKVVAVNDASGGRRYILEQIAGGVGTKVNNTDTIVSPSTYRQIGANLSILTAQVLKEFHRQQSGIPVIIRSDTLVVMDTPIVIRTPTKNQPMVLRYAVVVDPRSGRLDTLCWLIEKDDQDRLLRIVSPLQWLPPNKLIDCKLYVDASEYLFGIPSKNAYACLSIPQGQVQLNVPPNAERLAIQQRYDDRNAAALDGWLRGVVRHAEAALQSSGANR